MGKLGGNVRIRVLERDGYRCVYCGATAQTATLEIDHVIPLARGGTNDSTNLVTACRDCNNGKRASLIDLPDYVVVAPVAVPASLRPPRHGWLQEARLRWPRGDDAHYYTGDPISTVVVGRFATVGWCGGLSVHLHRTPKEAATAMSWIAEHGCKHTCWQDHELVDLAEPERIDRSQEWPRVTRRLRHFPVCTSCLGLLPRAGAAAIARYNDRLARAA